MRFLAALFLASAAAASAADCPMQAPRNAAAPSAGVTKVVIVARAGSLRVAGNAHATEVHASGTACASSKALLDQMRLTLTRSGSTITIETVVPSTSFGQSASLPVTITLPSVMPIDVRDSSGGTEIRDVGSAVVNDGSGSLEIAHVRGDLAVTDGSGSMTIDDVAGNVRIEDGSGAIDVKNVGASVLITSDASGTVNITKVRRDVTIQSKGSGAVVVMDVGGNFTVVRKGSGKIAYERVGGKVSLPSK